MANSFVKGKLDINALLAFVFGIVFLTTMLGFAYFVPNPSPFSQWVFVVTTSLAGAGIGAVIPGILNVTLPYARAGGALAVFLLVFLNKPALVETIAKFEPPKESSIPAIMEYLSKIDKNEIDDAWNLLDSGAKATVARDRDMYKAAYSGGRQPLGEVLNRTLIGSSVVTSPPGYPPGIYSVVRFKTRFASNQCHAEDVSTRGTTDMVWRVFDHNVSVVPIPCS
jgi:hypothetical protein